MPLKNQSSYILFTSLGVFLGVNGTTFASFPKAEGSEEVSTTAPSGLAAFEQIEKRRQKVSQKKAEAFEEGVKKQNAEGRRIEEQTADVTERFLQLMAIGKEKKEKDSRLSSSFSSSSTSSILSVASSSSVLSSSSRVLLLPMVDELTWKIAITKWVFNDMEFVGLQKGTRYPNIAQQVIDRTIVNFNQYCIVPKLAWGVDGEKWIQTVCARIRGDERIYDPRVMKSWFIVNLVNEVWTGQFYTNGRGLHAVLKYYFVTLPSGGAVT